MYRTRRARLFGVLAKIAVATAFVALLGTRAYAQFPSFTFTANVPTTPVAPGAVFTVPATVTNASTTITAVNYNTFFQVYTSSFFFQNQTFYTDQTFAPGQTIDYNVQVTAPNAPGQYFLAALMFDQNFDNPPGIVSQEFFTPLFNVEAVPEPSPVAAIAVGALCLGLLCLRARLRRTRLPG